MRGKSWSIEEERQLRQLVSEGLGITQITQVMGKGRLSVKAKIYNLGLSLVVATRSESRVAAATAAATSPASVTLPTSNDGVASAPDAGDTDLFCTMLKKDGPLPSIEEQLHVLNGAILALQKPGLIGTEVSRLSKIIDGVKVYQDLFIKFVDYRALENKCWS